MVIVKNLSLDFENTKYELKKRLCAYNKILEQVDIINQT